MSNTNDTIIPLIAGGTFTGTFQKRDLNSIASVNVFSDTTCDVRIQQAPNLVNVVNNDLFLYDPSAAVIFQQYLVLDYFRVVVTNTSGVDQTFLRVTSKVSNVLEPVDATLTVNLTPATDGILVYGANGGNTATPVAIYVDASGLIQDVNSAANTAVLANLDGCIAANKVAVDIGAVDISGQSIIVSNFAELVTDLSGVFVHVDNFPAEQVVDISGVVVTSSQHLNNLNATYGAGAVVGTIITANVETNVPYVTFELSSPTVFTVGQQVVISGATTFPLLNGVRTITEVLSSSVYGIYFEGLIGNGGDYGETGAMRSFGSSPLLADASGNLLVKVEGTAAVSIAGDVTTLEKPTILAYRNIATSSTGQIVSAVPATIRQFCAQNSASGSNQYIKLYDMAGVPTSADTPVFTFLLGAGSGIVANVILNHTFSIGIGIRATLLPADNDNTAAANYVFTNLTYSV